jgi:hypothetical protein
MEELFEQDLDSLLMVAADDGQMTIFSTMCIRCMQNALNKYVKEKKIEHLSAENLDG